MMLTNEHTVRTSLYGMKFDQLCVWLQENGGYSKYWASQVWDALYRQRVTSFAEMEGTVRADVLETVQNHFSLGTLVQHTEQLSADGTAKYLFQLNDGQYIESVLMRQRYGVSLCVTTQVGCNVGCSFCASGLLRKLRNLTAAEIVEQVMMVQRRHDDAARAEGLVLGRGDGSEGRKNGSGEVSRTGEFISHIVVMGIGEPMDNYDHVMQFLSIVTDRKGLQIGPRHITVSTSGFPARIKQFADAGMQTNLAISLHAPTNELRSQIMKINKAFPIEQLMEAVDYFIAIAHRRATISYIMLSGVNDRVKHAHELADLLSGRNVIVNLIPYNPVDELDHYQRSDTQTVSVFYDTLYKRGITVSVRQEQGADIDAACGQLRSKQMQQDKRVRAQ